MDLNSTKGPLTYFMEESARVERDPKIEGAVAGAKAALMAAPVGASVQALRGKNAYLGALVAGATAGLLQGAATAAIQKYRNLQTESALRYYLRNIVEREPGVALPPPAALQGFSQGFGNVYYPS